MELDRTFAGPSPGLCERVFGILQQLVDEMGAVVIAVGEQHWADAADVRAVAMLVFATNRLVVARHQARASRVITPSSWQSIRRSHSLQIAGSGGVFTANSR